LADKIRRLMEEREKVIEKKGHREGGGKLKRERADRK
jgi:hypothetical protein